MHFSLARGGRLSPCEGIPPVGGITRIGCGLLYYSPGSPQTATINKVGPHTTINYLAGNLGIGLNDQPGGADYASGGVGARENGSALLRLPGLYVNGGYLQCDIGAPHDDVVPGIAWQSTVDAGQAQCERRAIAGFFVWSAPNCAGGGQPCGPTPASARIAIELRLSDKQVRGWSDPGGDPRFGYNVGPSTISLPVYPALIGRNDVNGFKGRAAFGSTTVTTAHAVTFLRCPNNGSVRISVNGVVQSFPGPVNYLNLSAIGGGVWDANPGVWFPSLIRYEIFSAPALGGVLVSDLTTARGWGGDVIGTP